MSGAIGTRESYYTYGRSWANVSNTPFRYYKSYLYEGGISTPMIAYAPKRFGEPRVENAVGHIIDIVPTILDLTDARYPEKRNDVLLPNLVGKSLKSLLTSGPDQEFDQDRSLFWEHEGDRAVRRGDWKLVSIYPENKWRLYNLEKDRTELADQYDQHISLAQELEEEYNKWANNFL